jgi:hypothetical protein
VRVTSRRIQIDLDTAEPPTGIAAGDGGVACEFHGWLDLLRVLADLVDDRRPSP